MFRGTKRKMMEPVPPCKMVKKKRIVRATPSIISIVGMWSAALIDQTWFKTNGQIVKLLHFLYCIFLKKLLALMLTMLFCYFFRTTHFKGKNSQLEIRWCLKISPVILEFVFSTGQLYFFRNQGNKWRAWYGFYILLFIKLEKSCISQHNSMQAWFNIWM